ncbi:hypothetical protein TWF718_001702 [Orbilia javanica]|uniref:NADH dehydrogenase [ubiquinone] 1 alpha subcomplex subunit 1 n=1 Tax=Orbilia javanica TaxID=47235 RepID=A0AAN8RHI9_9PEZI
MPVPWETLLPFGLVIAMFTVSGAGMSTVSYIAEGYKPRRYNTDIWDHQMMRRDQRLTNIHRGQSDAPKAPRGFELSSQWRLEKRIS